MKLIEITIGDATYFVSEPFADSFAITCREASRLTAAAYPDAGIAIDVFLTGVPDGRLISVIKEYRYHTGQDLRASKETIDTVRHHGARIKLGNYTYDEAQRVADRFRDAGAEIEFPSPLEMLGKVAE